MSDDFIALLRDELAEMASTASVDMELWNRFSNRVLKAANVIEEQAVRIEEISCQYNNALLRPFPENMLKDAVDEIVHLRARIAELEAALSDTTAHLVAAVSLLERGGKKAAPSNTMFAQMLVDHKNSIDRARAALEKKND